MLGVEFAGGAFLSSCPEELDLPSLDLQLEYFSRIFIDLHCEYSLHACHEFCHLISKILHLCLDDLDCRLRGFDTCFHYVWILELLEQPKTFDSNTKK